MILNVDLLIKISEFIKNIKDENLAIAIDNELEKRYHLSVDMIDDMQIYDNFFYMMKKKPIELKTSTHEYLEGLVKDMIGFIHRMGEVGKKTVAIDDKFYDNLVEFVNHISFIDFSTLDFTVTLTPNKQVLTIKNRLPNDAFSTLVKDTIVKDDHLTVNHSNNIMTISLKHTK